MICCRIVVLHCITFSLAYLINWQLSNDAAHHHPTHVTKTSSYILSQKGTPTPASAKVFNQTRDVWCKNGAANKTDGFSENPSPKSQPVILIMFQIRIQVSKPKRGINGNKYPKANTLLLSGLVVLVQWIMMQTLNVDAPQIKRQTCKNYCRMN